MDAAAAELPYLGTLPPGQLPSSQKYAFFAAYTATPASLRVTALQQCRLAGGRESA